MFEVMNASAPANMLETLSEHVYFECLSPNVFTLDYSSIKIWIKIYMYYTTDPGPVLSLRMPSRVLRLHGRLKIDKVVKQDSVVKQAISGTWTVSVAKTAV